MLVNCGYETLVTPHLVQRSKFNGAVLVNVTVDDSAADFTGEYIVYQGPWNDGASCTVCTATPDPGFMYNRSWKDGTYYPTSSPPTGPLNATFSFNGTAIYVFCALVSSFSHPYGYSNMAFYIDDELVGHFEKIPPDNQGGYTYNVSVYSNTSLSAGKHTFMLQNGQFGNAGNISLTLLDYLVYTYDNGEPTATSDLHESSSDDGQPASTSSSALGTQMPTSSSSPPIAPRKSSPAVAIAGGAVGGIAGIVILCLLIWFLKRRRSRDLSKMNEKYSSFNLVKTSNQTIPQPFTAQNGGSSSVSASSSTGYLVTSDVPVIGYGVSINKNAAFQQRFITSGPSSATPSSSINPSASDFASSPARPPQPRDIDVGPVVLEDQNEGMLPPAYGQFFANLNSTVPPESSTSTVP